MSNNRAWLILSWNIRSVNGDDRWPFVRNKIDESNAQIVCLQETKKEVFDSYMIRKFAPRRFDQFAFCPSVGASGGLLIMWCSSAFSGQVIMQESFGLVVEFTSVASSDQFTLVNVYGPCTSPRREDFVAWLYHSLADGKSLF
jgi:exonuclease III